MHRARLLVDGRVQGVGYRYSACAEAQRLGLSGWVCNRSDGQVELEAEGPPEMVEALVAWCHRGPVFARVSRVEVRVQEVEAPVHDGFSIQS